MSNLLMNKDQILRSNDKKAELIRFIAVGGFATVLQYGMYIVFLMAVGTTAVVSTLISLCDKFHCEFLSFKLFHVQEQSECEEGSCIHPESSYKYGHADRIGCHIQRCRRSHTGVVAGIGNMRAREFHPCKICVYR